MTLALIVLASMSIFVLCWVKDLRDKVDRLLRTSDELEKWRRAQENDVGRLVTRAQLSSSLDDRLYGSGLSTGIVGQLNARVNELANHLGYEPAEVLPTPVFFQKKKRGGKNKGGGQ